MMTNNLKSKAYLEAILVFLISFSLPFISFKLDKISFQTNDDFGIMSFLAGYSTDGPKPQFVRIFEPLDTILRGLYNLNPNISWYVFFFLFIQAVSYSVIASIVISKLKDLAVSEKTVVIAAFLGLTLMYSLVFSFLQYTQVAIITTGVGTLGIIFRTKKSELAVSVFLLIIGLLIRPQAALPAWAIVFFLICGLFYINNKKKLKSISNRLFVVAGVAAGTYLIFIFSYNSWAPWISEERKELVKRQESVRNIYDYRPFNEANDLKLAAARDVGFSKNDYELIERYYFADADLFSSEKLSALEKEIKQRKDLDVYKKIISEFIFVFLVSHWQYLCFLLIFTIIVFKNLITHSLKSFLFTTITVLGIFFYTLLQGKIPFSVFYATVLISEASILIFALNNKKNCWTIAPKIYLKYFQQVASLALGVFFIFLSYQIFLQNQDKINKNVYGRSDYFLEISEVSKFKEFEYDKPVVAFSTFYSQLEQTQNPVAITQEDKKMWAQTVNIGWALFEPEYLSHIKELGLDEDLFSSVAKGDAYVGTAKFFEIEALSQYLIEHRDLRVTWVLIPVTENRSSLSGLSVWKVGTARPTRKGFN
jgi:hypothetical protein